jgi:hypothetical protein
MLKFEGKIKDNREQFDVHEPSPDHFERFSKKLARFNTPKRSSWNSPHVLRIAAVLAIFVVVSFLVSIFYIKNSSSVLAENSGSLPKELQEVETYYTKMNNEKMNQIEQLAGSGEEAAKVKEMALNGVKEINASTNELQKEYTKGAKNERVLDAIVNNYRIMNNLLDHIINELNQTNTEHTNQNQKNENQTI